MTTICIYHGNCADGFAAAWAVRERFRRNGNPEPEFHAGVYGEDPPDVTGKDVLIVDFSYKHGVLYGMKKEARSVLVIDHHKSAQIDLGACPTPGTWLEWQMMLDCEVSSPPPPDPIALFDMERSGATLTWDFLFPNEARPALINRIEDRDLWRFDLEGTREIHATLTSYPWDFDTWTALMATDPTLLINDGAAILRKQDKDIREVLTACERRMIIAGCDVPVANLPPMWASEAGHIMCQGEPFAATYFDTPYQRKYSLRSAEDGVDVSEIARAYGGGGHKHAAGFEVPLADPSGVV